MLDAMATIVVGIDGKPASLAALRWAVDIARARGDSVLAVSCWSMGAVAAFPGAVVSIGKDQPAEMLGHLNDAVDALGTDAEGVDIQTDVREGDAADVLVDLSRDPGTAAIVVGRPEKEHLMDRLVGSVITRLTHKADAVVVVVPAGEETR
jgi:nucleotide-binding universal stress UspA family protein